MKTLILSYGVYTPTRLEHFREWMESGASLGHDIILFSDYAGSIHVQGDNTVTVLPSKEGDLHHYFHRWVTYLDWFTSPQGVETPARYTHVAITDCNDVCFHVPLDVLPWPSQGLAVQTEWRPFKNNEYMTNNSYVPKELTPAYTSMMEENADKTPCCAGGL